MDSPAPILPPHIERTVRAIAQLHTDHHQQATRLDRLVDRATALLGRPEFLGVLTLFVLIWTGINMILLMLGRTPFDAPPFPWLGAALSLTALYLGTLILATQRRADRLASRREQMTLELGMMSEQKAAKIIELIEELRNDSPEIENRVDNEAAAMARPADAHAVLEAITDSDIERPAGEAAGALPRADAEAGALHQV